MHLFPLEFSYCLEMSVFSLKAKIQIHLPVYLYLYLWNIKKNSDHDCPCFTDTSSNFFFLLETVRMGKRESVALCVIAFQMAQRCDPRVFLYCAYRWALLKISRSLGSSHLSVFLLLFSLIIFSYYLSFHWSFYISFYRYHCSHIFLALCQYFYILFTILLVNNTWFSVSCLPFNSVETRTCTHTRVYTYIIGELLWY